MADTGGIAALMKALNEQPSLGSGLRNQGVGKSSAIARTARPAASKAVNATSDTTFASAVTSTSAAQTGAAALRAARGALATAANQPLPKVLGAGGAGYNPKAPKGTYLNLVV